MGNSYRAMISSDWSECLSPCGPFDCIAFSYPDLAESLNSIFRKYTGNRISLGEAAGKINSLLPGGISADRMDACLAAEFRTYKGVAELIEWCLSRDILFMINSTGMIGYFQRVFVKHLLPKPAALSAHPMIRYPKAATDPHHIYELFETRDKGRNTAAVAKTLGIAPDKIVLMGDSGGDGPHFEWGAGTGAYLIGSMTKSSLDQYCRSRNIRIHHRFGEDFSSTGRAGAGNETAHDFTDLIPIVSEALNL